MADKNSFDTLVSGLSSDERRQMLERMQGTQGDPEKESLAPVDIDADGSVPLATQLKNESIFFRFWLWLKSLISGTPAATLYNDYQVGAIAHNVARVSPNAIDFRRKVLSTAFFNRLSELKRAADFFKPYCSLIDGEGDFYVFLGMQGMPQVAEQMAKEVDPYSLPLDKGAKSEQRVSLLRRMDEVLANIQPEQKEAMYACARAAEWLSQLTKLPFNALLARFSPVTEGEYACSFADARADIDECARVLCNGRKTVPQEVLESLYLYYQEKMRGFVQVSAEEFIQKAHAQLAVMHTFLATVPVRSIGRVVHNNAQWQPDEMTGAEDWFVKYKMGWKRLFDQKWEAWTKDCKKEVVRQSFKRYFDLEQFPLLPARPWEAFGLTFRYELTGGFLAWFFKEPFPHYVPTFKTVMTEGDFMQKVNRTEFTEAFNALMQITEGLEGLRSACESGGSVRTAFKAFEDDRTQQGQLKAEQALRAFESDMGRLLYKFGEGSRKMRLVLAGLTGYSEDSRYDSLHNIEEIGGNSKENALFRKRLQDAKDTFDHALEIVKELEPIDTPNLKK